MCSGWLDLLERVSNNTSKSFQYSYMGGSWSRPHALFGWRFSSKFLTPAAVTSISGISRSGLGPVGSRIFESVFEKTDEYWLLRMFALPCGSEILNPSDLEGGTEQVSFYLVFTYDQNVLEFGMLALCQDLLQQSQDSEYFLCIFSGHSLFVSEPLLWHVYNIQGAE